ncbi:MAG TPA: hypothetical protein PK725_13330 [Rhodocyclaceae bacterium]|nr:hypothetical protein [Rhodocyclaceae bacterium]
MASQKVWSVKYVAGNPAMGSKVTTGAGGPFRRAEALRNAAKVAANGWRVWVEHHETGKRIFESEAERQFKRAADEKRIVEFAERNVPGFR